MNKFPSIKKGVYRHYKNNQSYEVLGIALQVETEEALVVYRPLYSNEYELFARPYEIFTETVDIDGVPTPRFVYVESGDGSKKTND